MPQSNEACTPAATEPVPRRKRSHCNEKPLHPPQLENSPCSPQLKKARVQQPRSRATKTICDLMGCSPPGSCLWEFFRQEHWSR